MADPFDFDSETQQPAVVAASEPAPASNGAEEFDVSQATYTPSEVAALGVRGIEETRDSRHRSLGINIELLKDYFAPVRPGQVAGIVGQTSHYKSGLLHYIEHEAAVDLQQQGRGEEAIIHVSLEETVEEQAFLEFARLSGESAGRMASGEVQDWARLISVSFQVAKVPIYRIGDSLERSNVFGHLYLSNVIKAIRWLVVDQKVKPALIAVDYLQALPPDPAVKRFDYETQRRLQVRADAYRLRELAVGFNAPVWCCVQAKQALGAMAAGGTGVPLLIPGMYDINESADVAQRFDRLLGVWLPARSYPVGTKLRFGNDEIRVTESMLLLRVNKQRGGHPAGRTFLCEIDFIHNLVRPYKFNA